MKTIPFSPPDISELEIEQVAQALKSGWITTGPKTKELERKVAAYCGVERAVCLNSQTACAEMALRILGVGEGDEVITSAYTYTASASVICHVGAKPVLIDTQKDGLEMDYEQLENAINERTKAIIPVDIAGIPCDYDKLFAIVEKKKNLFHANGDIQKAIGRVAIMADTAHAFGASWRGKPIGSVADFSSFSFSLSCSSLDRLFWKKASITCVVVHTSASAIKRYLVVSKLPVMVEYPVYPRISNESIASIK